jgi:hypothetical protein
MFMLSTYIPLKFLYIKSTIARPTVASAAAMVITKMANICPTKAVGVMNFENATKLILTALNISSMDIRMPMAFLRVKTPKIPMQKRMVLKVK